MANAGRVVTKTSQALSHNLTKSPPASWQALLAHPPPPSLTRAPRLRSSDDLPQKKNKNKKMSYRQSLKPQPIVWREDVLVDKLLADHPWEKHRPTSVTESASLEQAEMPVTQELAHWSRVPSIHLTARFILHLQDVHSVSLQLAYSSAVAQFRALKATQEASARFAQMEAESYGADFGPGMIGAGVKAEDKALDRWDAEHQSSQALGGGKKKEEEQSGFAQLAQGAVRGIWTGGSEYLHPAAAAVKATAAGPKEAGTDEGVKAEGEEQVEATVHDALDMLRHVYEPQQEQVAAGSKQR